MLGDRRLRVDLLGKLRRVVGFDAYAFLLTDPETAVGSSPLADVPMPLLGALPRLIWAKYLPPANRWTALDPGQVALLSMVGPRTGTNSGSAKPSPRNCSALPRADPPRLT